MSYSIEEIKQRYRNNKYICDIEIPRKVAFDHVFDEELSVRRNREMAKEHNANIDKMLDEKEKKNAELDKQMHLDVIEYIVNNYLLNEKQAEIVEAYVYDEYHSCMSDYFSNIDIVAEMVEKVAMASDTKA